MMSERRREWQRYVKDLETSAPTQPVYQSPQPNSVEHMRPTSAGSSSGSVGVLNLTGTAQAPHFQAMLQERIG
eukprot:UN28267